MLRIGRNGAADLPLELQKNTISRSSPPTSFLVTRHFLQVSTWLIRLSTAWLDETHQFQRLSAPPHQFVEFFEYPPRRAIRSFHARDHRFPARTLPRDAGREVAISVTSSRSIRLTGSIGIGFSAAKHASMNVPGKHRECQQHLNNCGPESLHPGADPLAERTWAAGGKPAGQ